MLQPVEFRVGVVVVVTFIVAVVVVATNLYFAADACSTLCCAYILAVQ